MLAPKQLIHAAVCLAVFTLAVQAADPLVGTWKVIPESAKYPGGRGPTNVVLKYETTGEPGELKFTLTGEFNGEPYSYSYTAKPDGKRYPVTGQSRAQEAEFQRPAPDQTTTVLFREGREIARHQSTISENGQVMTTRSRMTRPGGETAESSAQYRKQ